jgi:hypothetical protein
VAKPGHPTHQGEGEWPPGGGLDHEHTPATPPFRWSVRTGERTYWTNAQGAPEEGTYAAALDRLAPDWREHLAPA